MNINNVSTYPVSWDKYDTNEEGMLPDNGSGLPPVEGSGKSLVSVNGEWKEQEGYGYKEDVKITWDGNTEGKESLLGLYYKVSDYVPNNKEDVYGAVVTMLEEGEETNFVVTPDLVKMMSNEYGSSITIVSPLDEDVLIVNFISGQLTEEISSPATLFTHLAENTYVKKFTAAVLHKINHDFIPDASPLVITQEQIVEIDGAKVKVQLTQEQVLHVLKNSGGIITIDGSALELGVLKYILSYDQENDVYSGCAIISSRLSNDYAEDVNLCHIVIKGDTLTAVQQYMYAQAAIVTEDVFWEHVLPTVSSSDDGKVLKVVDGQWQAVLPE